MEMKDASGTTGDHMKRNHYTHENFWSTLCLYSRYPGLQRCGSIAKAIKDRLVSSSLDSAISTSDTLIGDKVATIENGPVDAWTVLFSPDSQYILSGSHAGKINL